MAAKIISIEPTQNRIYLIRKQKVMLDRHLAELYGVETRVLMQAVKRNNERFPEDCVPRTYEEGGVSQISSMVLCKR